MKKRTRIIVIIAAFLILFVPIPTGTLNDGGTQEFSALTYKIVKWNRVTSDESVYQGTDLYFIPNNFKSLDKLWLDTDWAKENEWLDKDSAEKQEERYFGKLVINEIYDTYFIATFGNSKVKVNDAFSYKWRVGDSVSCECVNVYYDATNSRYEADVSCISRYDEYPVLEKPVIYLYPEEKTTVSVKLELDGELTCTYPAYRDGWNVIADTDGTLTGEDGQTYNYLYWEGISDTQFDFYEGFCVRGEDTAAFLEDALQKLGLNRREANEFIVYWLPLMEQNPYNIIAFQTDAYTDAARLSVSPEPDTLIRVFMAWQCAESFVTLPEQTLIAPERNGFTVVEWGGTQVK